MEDVTDYVEEKCRDFRGAVIAISVIAGAVVLSLLAWVVTAIVASLR